MKSARAALTSTILTLTAVGQIVLSFVLYNENGSSIVRTIGWAVLWISAVFGWLPIFTLKRWGKTEGRGYVHTTVVVDRGIYKVVRHPQYLAGMLMSAALPLIAQHWLVALLGAVLIFMYYRDTFAEERHCIEKFGAAYERYRESAPRVNFIAGLTRLFQKTRKE
jgi:protein-S-isoprenylcysteine O-methyltransferase Ste14